MLVVGKQGKWNERESRGGGGGDAGDGVGSTLAGRHY